MARPYHYQLLRRAKRLSKSARASQADLRGAISSAYYAIFHFLIHHACRAVFGRRQGSRAYRDVLARAFDHGEMKDACKSFGAQMLPNHIRAALPGLAIHADVALIAQTFANAQEKRHHADYDLSRTFVRADVLTLVRGVENAIARLRPIERQPGTVFFLACLLKWETLRRRR